MFQDYRLLTIILLRIFPREKVVKQPAAVLSLSLLRIRIPQMTPVSQLHHPSTRTNADPQLDS